MKQHYGKVNSFYLTKAWRKVRQKVLNEYHGECAIHKQKQGHPHVRATIVHHIFHLDEYPQYGLMEFVPDAATGKPVRNLLPVCKECHETVCHPERLVHYKTSMPVTIERWD